MTEEKILTKEIAEQFIADYESVDLSVFTKIEDDAAESLSRFNKGNEGYLNLAGLTELSDAAAESLAKHEGDLSLDGLTELSDAAVGSLSQYKDHLNVGLISLSDPSAESLYNYKGEHLVLSGVKTLSDTAASSLAKIKGKVCLPRLTALNDTPAHLSLLEKLLEEFKDTHLDDVVKLGGLTSISEAMLDVISKVLPPLNEWANTPQYRPDIHLTGLERLDNSVLEKLEYVMEKVSMEIELSDEVIEQFDE